METYLSPDQIDHIKSIFKSKEDFIEIVSNLQKTGYGLSHVARQSPEMREQIQPQLNALKSVLGALRKNETFEVSKWIEGKSRLY
ncbi:MAG: hypothetical protein IAE62_00570 [Flavobacteriales bacterium]|nr:hypothetical protein [Flavobacteriales bacterium]